MQKKVTIDFSVWSTQAAYVRKHPKVSKQLLNKRVVEGKIETFYVPQLDMTLVKK